MDLSIKPEPNDDVKPTKVNKPRKRMKNIYKNIKEQMEFYFSDASLRRDRYLKKIIDQSEDKYVRLEVFTKFNKIQAMTTDIDVIVRALKRSDMLQISSDQQSVRRTTPLSEIRDEDDRTVYVECLPATADHDWLRKVFGECGHIDYVSLPRYHTTRDIKRFAFIEFSTQQAVDKACELLNNPPSTAEHKPGWFPKANKQLAKLERKVTEINPDQELPGEAKEAALKSNKKAKKRRHRVSESSSNDKNDCPDEKKVIKDELDSENNEVVNPNGTKTDANSSPESVGKNKPKKRKIEDDARGSLETGKPAALETPPATDERSAAKKKKHRKQKKNKKEKPDELPELRVMPKKQWLRLKKEYLALQKASMSALKKSLHSQSRSDPPTQHTSVPHSKQVTDVQFSVEVKVEKTVPIEFVPGLIVEVNAAKPVNKKDIREQIQVCAQIAYIDHLDGTEHGFIRCKDASSALSLAQSKLSDLTFQLVSGEAERAYWIKLNDDREIKLNTKRNKKRGSQKILERAEKLTKLKQKNQHIIFDD